MHFKRNPKPYSIILWVCGKRCFPFIVSIKLSNCTSSIARRFSVVEKPSTKTCQLDNFINLCSSMLKPYLWCWNPTKRLCSKLFLTCQVNHQKYPYPIQILVHSMLFPFSYMIPTILKKKSILSCYNPLSPLLSTEYFSPEDSGLIATNFGISSSSSICTCALTQPPRKLSTGMITGRARAARDLNFMGKCLQHFSVPL